MEEKTFEQLQLCYETAEATLTRTWNNDTLTYDYTISKSGKSRIISENQLTKEATSNGWLK